MKAKGKEQDMEQPAYRPTRDIIPSPVDTLEEDVMHHNNSQQNKKAMLGCKQAESPIVFYMAKLLAEDEAKEANAPTEQLKWRHGPCRLLLQTCKLKRK